MKVPFRLVRQPASVSADAELLLTDDPADLARIGGAMNPYPKIFRVDGGYLLLGSNPLPAGTIRLRRLGGELYIPVDAQLLPRLLPDEVVGLTRDRGLVVLVNTTLAFDPARPLPPTGWLQAATILGGRWRAFPTPPDRAERLTTIERPAAPAAVLEILRSGQPDDAAPLDRTGIGGAVPEDARPAGGQFFSNVGASLLLGAARLSTWIGKQLNAPGLAKFGGTLANKAIEKVPRITERILGAQEAALREVLRQLKSGDIEQALRRAPSAYADPANPGPVNTDADLGPRDPRFSLRDLLTAGRSGTWLGGGDVWEELAREYRRLAEDAAARGDARRAAYLYGVLLRDLRSAANALMAGGYFRDAAILFRDKLNNPASAANAFERAGDYDEAFRIYERLCEYETAAELLRRIGDEDRAIEFFERAAHRHQEYGRWCAAGDLLRKKLGRQQPATDCYYEGWRRSSNTDIACGERLVDDLLATESWTALESLLDEAARAYRWPNSMIASQFFNFVLERRELLPVDRQESLRDRVNLIFARHLEADTGSTRQASELVRDLYTPSGGWTGAEVRDAEYAVRASRTGDSARPRPGLHPAGQVSAIVVARASRDLVLAIDNHVVVWRVKTGTVDSVKFFRSQRVIALATDGDASIIHILYSDGEGVHIRCYTNRSVPNAYQGLYLAPDAYPVGRRPDHPDAAHDEPQFLAQGQAWVAADEQSDSSYFLEPSSEVENGEPLAILHLPGGPIEYSGLSLRERTANLRTEKVVGPRRFVRIRLGPDEAWEWDENFLRHVVGGQVRRWVVNWTPGIPEHSRLSRPIVDWAVPYPNRMLIVGVNQAGVIYWIEFQDMDPDNPKMTSAHYTDPDGFDAACLCSSGFVAAATRGGELVWLSQSGGRLIPFARPTVLGLPARVVFLTSGHTRREVIVVFEDGTILRVDQP